MPKIALGLSTLLLVVAASQPGVAQEGSTAAAPQHPAACIEYVAEYFGCLDYADLPAAQARTARGHPEFVEPQMARASQSRELGATPDRALHASRPVAPTHQ
jgi:hypothetical protein